MEPSWLDSVASDTPAAIETAPFRFGANIGCSGKKACLAKFARFAGENDMPALFGYLVALALLLGGGYAGLQWIASPDDVSTHQRIGEKPTARNVPRKSEKSEFKGGVATAVPGEADGGSRIGTTASAAADSEARHKSDHEANETETVSKPGDPTSSVNSENAADGCMPIGVTARGADVFPIQCQALIERRRGSVPSSAPPPTAAASGEVQAAELAKPSDGSAAMAKPAQPAPSKNDIANTERKHDVASASATKNLNSEPELRQAKPAEASREGSRDAEHKDDAQAKDQAKDIARTAKPGEPRSEPGVKPGRQDKRQAKRNVRSSRSGLVMMYLRTIEFPDGHREQQLLPIRRSPRMAVEAEDQW
jgi:hypothetical protein